MTCGVALQSVRQSGGVLILPCGRQRNGNSLRNHSYTVLVSLRYWMDATAALYDNRTRDVARRSAWPK
jgi:hypothetical protein